MPKSPPSTVAQVRDVFPKLGELSDQVLFGDVWERKGLSKRDRSLVTVAALVAGYRTNELPYHLERALDNGVSRDEIREIFMQVSIYAGIPAGVDSFRIAREVFAELDKG